MSLTFLERLKLDDLRDYLVPHIVAEMSAFVADKRFLSQKEYAEYFGYNPKTIAKRTNLLRLKGAVIGEGRQTRYDKTYKPNGERLLKQR
ncbi:MAG: hypothetical protein LBC64_08125 [Fibromonadaceae bacterium]|jgi:hypothetical protein|nr:hypothetical protein [Fibromonadaceae bacterium]